MITWLVDHVEHVGAVVGAILSLWALAKRLNRALLAHLDDSFPTRKEFHRLSTEVAAVDAKVSTILQIVMHDAHSRRVNTAVAQKE